MGLSTLEQIPWRLLCKVQTDTCTYFKMYISEHKFTTYFLHNYYILTTQT